MLSKAGSQARVPLHVCHTHSGPSCTHTHLWPVQERLNSAQGCKPFTSRTRRTASSNNSKKPPAEPRLLLSARLSPQPALMDSSLVSSPTTSRSCTRTASLIMRPSRPGCRHTRLVCGPRRQQARQQTQPCQASNILPPAYQGLLTCSSSPCRRVLPQVTGSSSTACSFV